MTDAADCHSMATVERTVAAIRPDWTFRNATPTEVGTDSLYYVTAGTPDGTAECVLKIRSAVDPAAFRPEPFLLSALGERTGVPVPAVVGAVVDSADVPSPCFLMERCPGETPAERGAWRPEVARRVARDAGRFAGEYHAVGAFERFGELRLGRDVTHDRAGIEVDGRRVTTADGAGTTFLDGFLDWHLDRLADRFADLEPALRAFCEERLDAAARAPGPVLAHDDYRPWNLLLDPETDATTAVLDWGDAFTADPHYDLLSTEQHLSRWAPLDGRLRAVVRDALREGYRETNRLERRPGFERRRELYLAATRLPGLVYFPAWADGVPAPEVERAARTHREYVRALVS